MSIALPLIGVLLAAIAAYLSSREGRAVLSPLRLFGVGLLLVVGVVVATRYEPELDKAWSVVGLLVGALAVSIPTKAGGAVGIAAAAALHLLPSYGIAPAQTAMLCAAGVCAILTGSYGAAIGAALVLILDKFGRLAGGSEMLMMAGTIVGVALLLGCVLSLALPKNLAWRNGLIFLMPLLAFVFLNSGKDGMLAMVGIAGVVTAGVLYFLLGESSSTLSNGIATIIAIGLATAAFALGRGTGMAAALIGSAGVLLLLDRPRALLALGPLFALTLFRLFRNIYPETSRAFDIGQHYALIGLMIGAILPLVLIDAKDLSVKGLPVLTLIAIALAPLMTLFFGPIGVVGFVVGLGFAATFELVRNGTSVLPLAAGTGLTGAVLLSYAWMAKSLELSRDEKIRVLMFAVAGIAVAAGVFALLVRGEKRAA